MPRPKNPHKGPHPLRCRHETRMSQEERRNGKLYAVVVCLEKGCGKELERRELKR